MNSDIRLLALVPCIRDTSPGQRFRMEQWEPYLREDGVAIRFEPFETPELHAVLYSRGHFARKVYLVARALRTRFAQIRSLGAFDAVYLFREAALFGPAMIERRIHSNKIPIIFDFDDAIFVPYLSPMNGLLSLLKCAGKTQTNCRIATHVMAGNRYLAEYAARFNPNVTVIPTTIDTQRYTLEPKHPRAGPLTIGWSGSHSTLRHLSLLRNTLSELAKVEEFRLRVISTEEYRLEGIKVESVRWTSASEVEDLRPIDIGIMPLPQDRWSQGKCACKALQYMALSIPTVCSPVGVNSQIIRDGQNGLLAATDREWIEKLRSLLNSAELRSRLGAAGRSTVEKGYSAKSQVPRVLGILRSVVR